MKKKLIAVIFTAALTLGVFTPITLLADEITVTIDGITVDFEDLLPLIINDRAFVPIRTVFEALGFDVDWVHDTQTVVVSTPTLTGRGIPRQVEGVAVLPGPNSIDAGSVAAMVIKDDGSLWNFRDVNHPYHIMDDVIAVSFGITSTFAITSDGRLWGWGRNVHGQLGDGTTIDRENPVHIMDDVIAVSATSSFTLAITSDGKLWGWGNNGSGMLIDGPFIRHPIPIHIMDDVIAVSTACETAMVITSDNQLWGWGTNNSGQLGDGTRIWRESPVHIMDNVVAVYVSNIGTLTSDFTMAITSDGKLWGWGSGTHNRLAGPPSSNSPILIMDDVVAVSAGLFHVMAITSDGGLWGWGGNHQGQLTDYAISGFRRPVRIMDDVAAVSAGGSRTIAVRSDGSLWVWGAINWEIVDYEEEEDR